MLPRMTGSAETPGSLTQTSTPARSSTSHMMRNMYGSLARQPSVRATQGGPTCRKDLRRLCDWAKLTIAGLHLGKLISWGRNGQYQKQTWQRGVPSTCRRDAAMCAIVLKNSDMVFGAHNDGRALWVGHSPPLGPPFSWLFLLISVGPTTFRRMPSPHHPGRSRAVQQPASVVRTPPPTERLSASASSPAVPAVQD